MAKIAILSNKSFNGVAFGTSRNEIRKIFGEYTEFKKSTFSIETTDDFGDFHCYYKNERLIAVEVFNIDSLYIDGIKVESTFTPKELDIFASDIKEDYGSYISESKSLGFSFDNGIVESVLTGKDGYYK